MQGFHETLAAKGFAVRGIKIPSFAMCVDWFKTQLALQKPHRFLWWPVFVGVGIALYFSLSFEPSYILGLLVLNLAGWGFYSLRCKEVLGTVMLFVLCMAVGFTVAQVRTHLVYTPILAKKMGPVGVTGVVHTLENLGEGSAVRIILKDVVIEGLEPHETPKRVRLKFRKDQDVVLGQKVEVLAGLNPPSLPVMPRGFDFQRYMFFKGIGAVGFAYGDTTVIDAHWQSGFYRGIETHRNNVAAYLQERLGVQTGAVASALMVGQKGAISEEDKEAIRDAGLAHMLAISGLHVGLFFGAIFFMARLIMAGIPALALNYPIKKYAAVVAMIGTVFYMLLAGAPIPTQRAVLMTAIVFLAILLDRTPLSLRLVSFAALVILLLFPESLLTASFHMSFAAVAGLVAFFVWLRPYWSALHSQAGFMRRVGLYFLGVVLTDLIATSATAPFALFHFQQLAVFSLLANFLAMPVLAFLVMPFAVLYFILSPIGLGGLAIPFVGWGISLILEIAHFVSGLEHSVLRMPVWPTSLLLILAVSFLSLILLQGRLKFICVLPFILFIFGITQIKQVDILISSNSKLMAVRDQSGSLAFSNLRADRFTRENWARAYGFKPEEARDKWPKEGQKGDLYCGEQGCRLERDGVNVSVLKDVTAFEEACGWAELIIAPDPLPRCKGAYVIDRFDTYRNGAYAITFGKKMHIENTEMHRGARPWVARAQSKSDARQW